MGCFGWRSDEEENDCYGGDEEISLDDAAEDLHGSGRGVSSASLFLNSSRRVFRFLSVFEVEILTLLFLFFFPSSSRYD